VAQNAARFGWSNFAQFGNTLLTASSTVSGRSVRWLRDQARSKTWRSATGWSFVQRFNDELAFNEASVRRIAYVTPATYATGALAAAQIQTAMNASGIDPLSLSPTLWLKADAQALADGATMTTWTDSSGNARHMNSVTGAPLWYRSVLNGRPAVRFDGASHFEASANAVQTDDVLGADGIGMSFVVAWVDSDHSSYDALWSTDGGLRGHYLDPTNHTLSRARDAGGSDDATSTATYSTGAWHLFVWTYDGTNVQSWVDDADTAAVDGSAASGAQTSLGDDLRIGNGSADFLKGFIAEVMFFTTALSEENRRRIVQYLEQKYALSTATTAATWTNTYTAAYSATTFKFTLARSAGSDTFGFPWTLDDYEFRSMGTDLGFDTSADDTGATTYTGDAATYQSRHWVEVDLGSTGLTSTLGAVLDHNSDTSSGTYTIQAHTVPFWETGSPSYSATLAGDADIRLLYFGSDKTYRYWRVLISDTTNLAGYNEFGILFLGPYTESTRGYAPGVSYPRNELSGLGASDQGGPFFHDRPTIEGFDVAMTYLSSVDKTAFDSMLDFVKNSRCFFFSRDASTTPADTSYVFLPEGAFVEHMSSTAALYQLKLSMKVPPQ